MTCAACDDCPADAWHLHITVKPPREWGFADISRALECDIARLKIKPVVVTNHFRDARPPYKELIPTKHFKGSEAEATRELFRLGTLLNNSGWRIRRLKIEGDARVVTPGRALYYEAHVKNPSHPDARVPRSTNAKGDDIYTLRHPAMGNVYENALRLHGYNDPWRAPINVRIEACVLDTAPERDNEWMNQ